MTDFVIQNAHSLTQTLQRMAWLNRHVPGALRAHCESVAGGASHRRISNRRHVVFDRRFDAVAGAGPDFGYFARKSSSDAND